MKYNIGGMGGGGSAISAPYSEIEETFFQRARVVFVQTLRNIMPAFQILVRKNIQFYGKKLLNTK